METILLEILEKLKATDRWDDAFLEKIIHRHNKNLTDISQHHSKKKLLPYYLKVKKTNPERWASWGIDESLEERLLQVLQVKPRRTASGVATISVITKPWKCLSDCLYCPNDLRMPKSYLSDEPACQRAERNFFDPYLQVVSRLRTLIEMGHPTDKIELIVLGGSWSDYPIEYQIWFIKELFRALNDDDCRELNSGERYQFYEKKGLSNDSAELKEFVRKKQQEVIGGSLTYNQAVAHLYEKNEAWKSVAAEQMSDFSGLTEQHHINESAQHRAVGLVVEIRPDLVTCDNLKVLRRLGCTKIQMGVQSLNPSVLQANERSISLKRIEESFELLRLFGFKIHSHFMLNLYGASPEDDKEDYRRFVTEKPYLPDEVKLYPCSLVNSARLRTYYENKTWRPYSENELLDVLTANTLATPPYMRISRMIRDFAAHDIIAGNKKTNFRQMVESRIKESGETISEIRYREISTDETDINRLELEVLPYETTVTREFFLQWVTPEPESRVAGFLRLSLPNVEHVLKHQAELPINPHEAMIREVHIYGKVAKLRRAKVGLLGVQGVQGALGTQSTQGIQDTQGTQGAQHLGLGRQLIERACEIAAGQGYTRINVISSVGTREYYRSLGFKDCGLYQQKSLR